MTACGAGGGETSAEVSDESAPLTLAGATGPTLCKPLPTVTDLDLGAPLDVSESFRAEDASTKVSILRLTGSSGEGEGDTKKGPANVSTMLTYYDVTGYLREFDRLIYNAHRKQSSHAYNYVVTSDVKGMKRQALLRWESPTTPTSYAFPSDDGRFLAYIGETGERQFELFGVWLDVSGRFDDSCTPIQLTHGNFKCTGDEGKCLEHPSLSPPVRRSISVGSAGGGTTGSEYVIAFAVGSRMYAVTSDGKPAYPKVNATGESTASDTGEVNLHDDAMQHKDHGFHRVRINPAFPHLVMYRRAKGTKFESIPGLFLADLSNQESKPVLAINQAKGFHPVWRPDGMAIGVNKARTKNANGGTDNVFTEYVVTEVDEDNVARPVVGTPRPFINAPKNVFYAAYSSHTEKPLIAFATGLEDKSTTPEDPRAGKIYVMPAIPTATPKPLAYTNFKSESVDGVEGQPRLSFFRKNSGIVFSTDNGQVDTDLRPEPLIYTITKF